MNWTDVRDKMPPDSGERLLVVYRNQVNNQIITICRYAGGAWRFLDRREKSRISERVTHWMRFPALPKWEKRRPGDREAQRVKKRGVSVPMAAERLATNPARKTVSSASKAEPPRLLTGWPNQSEAA